MIYISYYNNDIVLESDGIYLTALYFKTSRFTHKIGIINNDLEVLKKNG